MIEMRSGLGARGVPGEPKGRCLLLSVVFYYWEAPVGFSDEAWAPLC